MVQKYMIKQYRLKLNPESFSDETPGQFTGYASVFGTLDSQGDIVDPGAFKKTLKEQKRTKLLWSHYSFDPGIGYVELEEDEKGLYIKRGQLYLDIQRAKEAYINMKNETLDGLSIGYDVVKEIQDTTNRVNHLKEVALWEVSLCNFQACPGAIVSDVKSRYGQKPYPGEHSARLADPDEFDRFRRKADGKLYNKIKIPETIDVIWGHLEGGADDEWAAQSLRFPTADWTASEAKTWLKDNEVKYIDFEPAKEPEKSTLIVKPELLHLTDRTIMRVREYRKTIKGGYFA